MAPLVLQVFFYFLRWDSRVSDGNAGTVSGFGGGEGKEVSEENPQSEPQMRGGSGSPSPSMSDHLDRLKRPCEFEISLLIVSSPTPGKPPSALHRSRPFSPRFPLKGTLGT